MDCHGPQNRECIATFVFFDLETTGLPSLELNKTKITELSMLAISRNHILDTEPGNSPRVSNKLTLCFNPGRLVSPESTDKTGLCNFLLESSTYFSIDVFKVIDAFLAILRRPICLIAHNGEKFDFPILKNHFSKLQMSLHQDIVCADTLEAFYDILEGGEKDNSVGMSNNNITANNKGLKRSLNEMDEVEHKQKQENDSQDDDINEQLSMKSLNETTPKAPKIMRTVNQPRGAKKRLSFSSRPKSTHSYKLESIYERVLRQPPHNAHQAESDCIMTMKIAVALNERFVKWVDMNCRPFADVKPMTLGVPLGK